jgi:ribonuclease VapC
VIVVDTSAVVAIMTGEPGADDLTTLLADAPGAFISAATVVELAVVLESRVPTAAAGSAERFLREAGVDVIALDAAQAQRAMEGWRRFGRGRHAAGLNLGDCYTYALASTLGHPVLCTGNDFARTDLAVIPSRA